MRRIDVEDGQTLCVRGDAAIRVASGARAEIVFEIDGTARIGLAAGEESAVRCYMICKKDAGFALTSHVGRDARVDSSFLWLCSARAEVTSILEGKGAEAHDMHAFIGEKNQALRLCSVLRHYARDTRGDVLIKGVVKDSASAALGGMIRIEKGGSGAESFLSEHVMLLGPDANASANPELEICNNDVSSRHAASVSRIDEGKVFYLMSRGIRREDACGLIARGFLESALSRMGDERRGWMMESAEKALGRG